MGYCTSYSLTVRGFQKGSAVETASAINDALIQRDITDYALSSDYDDIHNANEIAWDSYDPVKWYDHERDMKAISKDFPDLVFCLEGMGEENTDMWRKYFKNGDVEHCPAEIVYPKPKRISWD